MTHEWWDKLKADHPHLYSPPQIGGHGWYELLDKLMSDLETVLSWTPVESWPNVVQIKEKFGGLRFYFDEKVEIGRVNELVTLAEQRSMEICDTCGQPGELRKDRSWMRTLCDKCAAPEDQADG